MKGQRHKIPEYDIKDRMKKSSSPSSNLGGMWAEQRRQAKEEALLQQQYKAAKKQARELRRSILKNQFDTQIESVGNLWVKVSSKLQRIPKLHILTQSVKKSRRLQGSIGVVMVLTLGIVLVNILKSDGGNQTTLGNSTVVSQQEQQELPREKPAFSLLFPSGTTESDYEVVRISPKEAAPSYTYLDKITDDGPIFRVTQQEIPESFNLSKTATDFQATNIIKIDDQVIYHGYSEKDGIQSLLFTKDSNLVLIKSNQRLSDDTWASYYLSLE